MRPEKSKYSFRRVGKQMGSGALRVGKFGASVAATTAGAIALKAAAGDPMSRIAVSMAMRKPGMVAEALNPFG